MNTYHARHMIEALRAGVPSKTVGAYFSDSRKELLDDINAKLDQIKEDHTSEGKVILGRYGEGKTHLLNTIREMASNKNMVVSIISISKETPFNNLAILYKKLMANTYLPKAVQPGVFHEIDSRITPNSDMMKEMLLFASTELEIDRLFYIFKSFIYSKDKDDHYLMQSDMEGDFITTSAIKQLYTQCFHEKMNIRTSFKKGKHINCYISFMAHLFRTLGYNGWVILFDEAELIGRLGRKSRVRAYCNMYDFLFPSKNLDSVYTLAAFSTSFPEEILRGRDDIGVIQNNENYCLMRDSALKSCEAIEQGEELKKLTDADLMHALGKIIELYEEAYDWHCPIATEDLYQAIHTIGYLLRTTIRAAIEYLDQLYIYGNFQEMSSKLVEEDSLEEDLSLDSLFEKQD